MEPVSGCLSSLGESEVSAQSGRARMADFGFGPGDLPQDVKA